jgi:glycosyltransferase involved in cell wall biosynthesis
MRRRPDVVHLYMLKARLLGALAARVTGVPVVVETLHGNLLQGYYNRMFTGLILWIERVSGRVLVDRVIAVTSGQRDELLRFGIAPRRRMALQLPGMDVSAFRDLSDRRGVMRGRLGLSDATMIVGTIGRLVPIKGLDVFLDAAARVLSSSSDVCFVIAGDGPLRQDLEAQRDRLGLGERCVFLGEVTDIRGFYADTDIVVMSSRNEGAPIVLIEATAAGRPIVATRVGGVPDMVEDGVSALLVPPDDAAALGESILRVVRDEGLRRRMSAAAAERSTLFSVAAFGDGTDRLYREVAGLKPQRAGPTRAG